MKRSKLRRVIAASCDGAGVKGNERKRLVDSADEIDRIAVGVFKIRAEGIECGCPATVAGFYIGEEDDEDAWAPGASAEIHEFPSSFDQRMDDLAHNNEIQFVRHDRYDHHVVEVTD